MKKIVVLFITIAVMISHRSFTQGTNSKELKLIEKSIVLSNNIRLEYVEQGDAAGIPVIFLHGLSDSWHSFETVLANLPASVHAFAISQRGHGDSERPLHGYTPKDFAADLADFIKQKKLGSAFIVGHSMGGVNTQQFALDYPLLLRGIVIIDSDPAFKDNPGMPEFFQQVQELEGAIARPFMDEFQKSTLSKSIDEGYYNLLVDEGLKVPMRVFKDAFKGLMEVDYTSEIKTIKAPVLIMWGEKDAFCFRKDQEQFVTSFKNAKLIVYENTGHALHWEKPKRFASDLVAFVSSLNSLK